MFTGGVEAASLCDVGVAAKLTKGGVQRHFPRKELLVTAVAEAAIAAGRTPTDREGALEWARLWVALRTASGHDEQLAKLLDTLALKDVAPVRLRAIEELMFARNVLFAAHGGDA